MSKGLAVGFVFAFGLGSILEISVFAEADDDVATPSIIGGVESPAGDYPWMGALVQIDEEDLAKAQVCGCSLIDEKWILTAAHCLDGYRAGEIAVAFGEGDLEKANIVVPIDLIVMHPEYFDVIDLNNDMALARLVRPVEGIEPIELNSDANLVSPGSPIRVIGWGLTDILQNDPSPASKLRQADLTVLDRDWVNSEDELNGGVTDLMLPIGTLDPLVTSSFGDSGGPMITFGDGKLRLAGVTSWGTGCFTSFLPYSVYTDVIPYLSWIENVVNRDRVMWEKAHGVSIADNEDAYRVGGAPEDWDRLPFFFDGEGLKTKLVTRPFSTIWKYLLSYYDSEEQVWREFAWNFDDALSADGSVALSVPEEAGEDTFLIRTQQVARSSSRSELMELPFNQLVSGKFDAPADSDPQDVRAFRISNIKDEGGYKVLILSKEGPVRYDLRSSSGDPVRDQSGVIEGRVDLEISEDAGGTFWLYLLPVDAAAEFSVYLTRGESGPLSIYSSAVSGLLEEGDAELGDSRHFIDSYSLSGTPNRADVFVVIESQNDMAIRILDTDTLLPVGQSNAWSGSQEYFLFNRSSRDRDDVGNLIMQLVNADPDRYGSYRFELSQVSELRSLSLANEFDFRALTVRDYTEDTLGGNEYVDRLELTSLGTGKRFVEFIGFESFRPFFAVRNITDDIILEQFDRAFCYETSVIEFTAAAGKRYEVIVAGGEWYLNKNYFIEVSTTRPPNPYERFSTTFSDRNAKMDTWLRRRNLRTSTTAE